MKIRIPSSLSSSTAFLRIDLASSPTTSDSAVDMASISPERSITDPDTEEKKLGTPGQGGIMEPDDLRNADGSSVNGSDVLALQDVDPALNMKMHLVNNVSRRLRRFALA